MTGITEKLSKSQLRICLIIFIFAGTVFCLYKITSSLLLYRTESIKIDGISVIKPVCREQGKVLDFPELSRKRKDIHSGLNSRIDSIVHESGSSDLDKNYNSKPEGF
ncbi:hypothetical protein HNP37_004652 [Flavobacterium nitrogenifigens]|uniref:Uncharacterized protein n=2 Tax=Flavobacterium TaxID=237 RepID=A0A7W7J2T0_9FLAO|nr:MULTISPECIES: hypothetical protein [Flavobacterium]MBB4804555.1 hypothetical protein [Flavobacterium nitrogenifigens]MBB6389514.1 hypothetical protein [Flavobacterium notoginsengisoli]